MVYYIRRGGYIKIGQTVNFRSRMNMLRPDAVLAIEPGGVDVERERHWQFRQLHVLNHPDGIEWFEPGDDLLDHIAALPDHKPPIRTFTLPPKATIPIGEPPVSNAIAAHAVGVHPGTLWRWVDTQRVHPPAYLRTAGGHLRWDLAELRRQLEAAGREGAEP